MSLFLFLSCFFHWGNIVGKEKSCQKQGFWNEYKGGMAIKGVAVNGRGMESNLLYTDIGRLKRGTLKS